MKVMELFESPKHTFPTDFGLDEFDYNVKFGQELLKQYSKVALEKVGDGYTLWEFKREFALIRDEDSYVAYYMKFRFDMINLIKRQCVSQIAIWRSRMVNEQSGMAKRIFMNHLIPKYGNIITDSEQTEDGRRFWADRIREYIERGYKLEQFEEQITNELISGGAFKPEFLNRFDEIVVFRPLNKSELLQVIDLILAGINRTLSAQKVSIAVDDDAKLFLVDRGYDPRLGARPMRRVVQRAVENTVAKLMLAGSATPGQTIRLSLEDVQNVFAGEDAARAIIEPTQEVAES